MKRCESTGLRVNSGMTIETEMSLNADGNTAATACHWYYGITSLSYIIDRLVVFTFQGPESTS